MDDVTYGDIRRYIIRHMEAMQQHYHERRVPDIVIKLQTSNWKKCIGWIDEPGHPEIEFTHMSQFNMHTIL